LSDDRAKRILDRAHHVTAHDIDGKLVLNTYQDVEPHLEYAKKMRRADAEARGRFGKRRAFHPSVSPPFNVIQKICMEHKLDFFNKDDAKKVVAIVKRDYPHFKTSIDKH
jgi:hypothetical protein